MLGPRTLNTITGPYIRIAAAERRPRLFHRPFLAGSFGRSLESPVTDGVRVWSILFFTTASAVSAIV